jgi:hypothetical protein
MPDLILMTKGLPRFRRCGNREPVTTEDLQPQQLRAVAATSARMRDYFLKLRARMEALRFPVGDPLYSAVCRAADGASHVTVVAASTANRREAGTHRPEGDSPPQ